MLAACAANQAAERARLIRTVEACCDLAQARDLEGLMTTYTDDAVVLAPEVSPLEGKEAIREYIASVLTTPRFSVHWTVTGAELAAAGDMGYVIEDTSVIFPDGSGGSASSQGKSITIWRKQVDDTWRCIVDIWNEPPSE